MRWVYQPRSFGLGNFITATPALQDWHRRTGDDYHVYFETPELGDLFSALPGCRPINYKPDAEPWLMLHRSHLKDGETDYEYYHRLINGKHKIISRPYVDSCDLPDPLKTLRRWIAIFVGCAYPDSSCWRSFKLPPIRAMDQLALIPDAVIVGSQSDTRIWTAPAQAIDLRGSYSLRETVAILQHAKFWVGNDSGLYHVAAASGVPGICLWNRTPMPKNLAPSDVVLHVNAGNGMWSTDSLVRLICHAMGEIGNVELGISGA